MCQLSFRSFFVSSTCNGITKRTKKLNRSRQNKLLGCYYSECPVSVFLQFNFNTTSHKISICYLQQKITTDFDTVEQSHVRAHVFDCINYTFVQQKTMCTIFANYFRENSYIIFYCTFLRLSGVIATLFNGILHFLRSLRFRFRLRALIRIDIFLIICYTFHNYFTHARVLKK